MIRLLYIILGIIGISAGFYSWLGVIEISQFTAACYAFCYGVLMLGEGVRGGRS